MSEKRVLLVVRAVNGPPDPKRQLEWLEQNIFPQSEYPRRRLVYVGFLNHVQEMKDAWKYDAFENFEDVYAKLRSEGYFVNTFREPRHFDFALLVHIRRDYSPGLGYGLEECAGERCLLRAMFLAARGNLLFVDWGVPYGISTDVTREQLMARRKLNQYIYVNVHHRRFPDLTANVPFTQVVDHFLNPISEADPGLPPEHMNRIRAATNGELFTSYQLKLGIWNAWWNLYFATDAICVIYHRWIHFRYFQMAVVDVYVYVRSWTVSSTWLELFIDSCGFVLMSLLYGILALFYTTCVDVYNGPDYSIAKLFKERFLAVDPLHFTVFSIIRYAWWMALTLVLFDTMAILRPQDRIPIREKLRNLWSYSSRLPLFDIWIQIWLNRDVQVIQRCIMVWISLGVTDLATHWFFIPFTRDCVAFAALSVLISMWTWMIPDLPVVAWWMLEQGLWMVPLFLVGRLRLHRELKRSFLYVPWIASVCILFFQIILQQTFLKST